MRDFERKIGVLETKEVEERNKRIRVEEEMREYIDEKESKILRLRKKIAELEEVVVGKKSKVATGKKIGDLESNVVRLREKAED